MSDRERQRALLSVCVVVVLIRRNAMNDSCHNFTALMPRCTKTLFIVTAHYACAHRNSDNLHNAVFIG